MIHDRLNDNQEASQHSCDQGSDGNGPLKQKQIKKGYKGYTNVTNVNMNRNKENIRLNNCDPINIGSDNGRVSQRILLTKSYFQTGFQGRINNKAD